jgi:hypothetical protein
MGNHLGNSHDYLCPNCKTGENLSIEIKVWATLSCDGTDVEGQDNEWDDTNRAICKMRVGRHGQRLHHAAGRRRQYRSLRRLRHGVV